MIPVTAKIYSGDKGKAAHYLGLAQRQLNILLNQMKLAQPKPRKLGYRKLDLKDGAYILATVCYNTQVIKIHIPFGGEEAEEQKKYYSACFSVPHFAIGKITAVTPNLPEDYTEEEHTIYANLMLNQRMLYDLEICDGSKYIEVENVVDANFGTYYVDQKVLVTIGAPEDYWLYPLDPFRRELMDAIVFSTLMVSPIILSDMNLWRAYELPSA